MPHDDRVLVDYRTADDAGVYRFVEGRALVQTVDFFTPIVDDPFVYGQIAAANALSDVYAMGGIPLTALAIAAFPRDLERDVVRRIFAGGVDKLAEAGVALLGGHTVQDTEIKFGYSVTGEVDPARILANAGARPGDALILTKRLGTGIISTALKFGRAPESAVSAAVASMSALNKTAAETLRALPAGVAHACTDITGFGLAGHACEVAEGSRCTLEIELAAIPLLEGVRPLVAGNIPGGGRTNRQNFSSRIRIERAAPADLVELVFDPQTSGGLLVSLQETALPGVHAALAAAGVTAWTVGRVVARTDVDLVLV